MSKKKKNIIIAVTALLFFGALLFNLKYPLMSETYAKQNTVAQNKLATDNKTGGSESKLDKQKAGEQEKDRSAPEVAKTETSETEVKLDANTGSSKTAKSGTSSTSSNSGSTSSGGSKPSSGGTSSGGSGSSGTTPAKPSTPAPKPQPTPEPTPALKPFTVPASNSFGSVYKSTDSDSAELLIVMNSAENYETQLNELYNVIAPVVGSSVANQIISYARTKTEAHMSLDKSWPVTGRTLKLGSTWGSWSVSFYSWRK